MAPPRPVPAGPLSISARALSSRSGLERVLRDLGPQIRRGGLPVLSPGRCPTGMAAVDGLLDGGFPRGHLSEIVGAPSSGRTALARALLAGATRAGEVVGVIDAADAFDPASAAAAGIELARVLWVRAPHVHAALRSAERLLQARGFPLVLIDLAGAPGALRGDATAAWSRLARAAAGAEAALVVLAGRRLAGASAELALEMQPRCARFTGTPALLEGLEVEAVLARARRGAEGRAARIGLRVADPAA